MFSAICLSWIFAESKNLLRMPIFGGSHFWSSVIFLRSHQMVKAFLANATFFQETEIYEEEM